MSTPWEEAFREGIEAFRSLEYRRALRLFDAAIARGGERYTVYDSRAAVHEKIGKIKDALKDSRKVMELAPHMRHGYTRSARLFLLVGKHDSALEMARFALDRIKPGDNNHRSELEELRRAALNAKGLKSVEEARRQPHIVKLPVELISEIFMLAAAVEANSPVRLSLVCHHWRAIALSIPFLWSHMELSNIRPVSRMELWQARSKGQITSLRICSSISRLQLQDALAKCGPRFCKSLKSLYCGIDLVCLWTCLMGVPNCVDLDLEEIHVAGPGPYQIGTLSPSLLIPFHEESSARSLIIENADVNWAQAVPKLTHLRTLIVRTRHEVLSTVLVCTLLGNNPFLEEVILEIGSPLETDTPRVEERIELPCLSHLQLLGPIDASFLISRLSLSALKRLVIGQSLHAADDAILKLDPPFPALTELSIYKCSFDDVGLVSFLQRMSTLTKLEITGSGSRMDALVDALSGIGGDIYTENKQFCPELQHVDFSHSLNLHGGPIVRLVKSRLQAVAGETGTTSLLAKIKVLYIDGCPGVDPIARDWLRDKVQNVSCVYMTKEDIRKLSRRTGIYQ